MKTIYIVLKEIINITSSKIKNTVLFELFKEGIISVFSDLFKHELSQSTNLVSILRMIHDVVLHEKGLQINKVLSI